MIFFGINPDEVPGVSKTLYKRTWFVADPGSAADWMCCLNSTACITLFISKRSPDGGNPGFIASSLDQYLFHGRGYTSNLPQVLWVCKAFWYWIWILKPLYRGDYPILTTQWTTSKTHSKTLVLTFLVIPLQLNPQTMETYRAALLFCTFLGEGRGFTIDFFNIFGRMNPGESVATLGTGPWGLGSQEGNGSWWNICTTLTNVRP